MSILRKRKGQFWRWDCPCGNLQSFPVSGVKATALPQVCPKCTMRIQWSKVSESYYTDAEGNWIKKAEPKQKGVRKPQTTLHQTHVDIIQAGHVAPAALDSAAMVKLATHWAKEAGVLTPALESQFQTLLKDEQFRLNLFLATATMQKMRRMEKFLGFTEDVEKLLFDPVRLAGMNTEELLQSFGHLLKGTKDTQEFLMKMAGKGVPPPVDNRQVHVNVSTPPADVPANKMSRETIRNYFDTMLREVGKKREDE